MDQIISILFLVIQATTKWGIWYNHVHEIQEMFTFLVWIEASIMLTERSNDNQINHDSDCIYNMYLHSYFKDDKRSRSMCWKISINHQFRFFISVCNCLIFSPSHNDIYDDKIKPYKVLQRERFFIHQKNI